MLFFVNCNPKGILLPISKILFPISKTELLYLPIPLWRNF